MPSAKNIDKDLLYDLYYNQQLTAKEICQKLGICEPVTIYKYMDKYGIHRYNQKESNAIFNKNNHNNYT